ncbi:hypothetical protein [Bradyrhizobium valentinum]|uniref:hypothetical protein n=1 Tax=Bradyrhizobium valentinum TaxID=1518501 RepID=UPI0007159BE1|nr:hypothetical protein [Bradyrhizobium valentinum]KRQ92375.1 hypothetical protein CQ10_08275 [Bradyrhizobium valentinum]
MSFKVIDGGGPDKEGRDRQREQEWASSDFSSALRECAANVLRVVRGAGKPYELLVQMQEVVDKAIKYREAHGYYPSSDLILTKLALHDEYKQQRKRDDRGEINEESRHFLREEGEFTRLHALHVIHCGALQIAASGLIGQDTQQRAGESELHRGLTMWQQWLEEQRRKRQDAASVTRAGQKRLRRQGEAPAQASRPVAKAASPEPTPARQSQRTRRQRGFGEADLKELRKAIKAKDAKKIAELTAKIGRRPSDD